MNIAIRFLIVIFLVISLTGCRYLDGGLVFLRSDDCMRAIKQQRQTCQLVYDDFFVPLIFSPAPHLKGAPFNLEIKSHDIESATAEMIGLNMEMPRLYYSFSRKNNLNKRLMARIEPGICTETQMRWRLKITMISKKQETYYTFIDYVIGR